MINLKSCFLFYSLVAHTSAETLYEENISIFFISIFIWIQYTQIAIFIQWLAIWWWQIIINEIQNGSIRWHNYLFTHKHTHTHTHTHKPSTIYIILFEFLSIDHSWTLYIYMMKKETYLLMFLKLFNGLYTKSVTLNRSLCIQIISAVHMNSYQWRENIYWS